MGSMARTSKRARKSSPLHLPGAFDLFTPSKELVLKNIWIFGPLYAVPFIFWIHSWIWSPLPNQPVHWWQHSRGFSSGWPGGPLPTYGTFLVVGFSILWFVIIGALGTIAQIMSQAAQLEAAEGRHLDFHNLWAVVKDRGWRMFGLYIVTGLIVLVGLILLIIPGLIMIRRYFLAPYVMLDKNVGIREALDRSAELSKVNTGSIWGILGVMLLIGMVNIIPILGGLVSFALGSLYSVAPALRYEQLKKLA
jgi:hypothetical protein